MTAPLYLGYTPTAAHADLEALWAGGGGEGNARIFGAVGNGIADDTIALQAWIDAATFPVTEFGVPRAYLPAGTYKITSPLRVHGARIDIRGEGRFNSRISYNDVVGGCLVWDAMAAANVTIKDLSIIGNGFSGPALDFSLVALGADPVVYNGLLENLNILAGEQAILIPNVAFSMKFDSIFASSENNHVFQVMCGPSTSWINCYAGKCGPAGGGKAGYRLTGTIRLYSCNGINEGDHWGIFGSDPASVGDMLPYAGDFAALSYADAELHGCNVEAYGVNGLWCVNGPLQLTCRGGGFVRNLAPAYHSDIRIQSTFGGVIGCYVHLDAVRRLTSGGAVGHKVYADTTGALLVTNDAFPAAWDAIYSGSFALAYPAVRFGVIQDEFGERALDITRLTSDAAYVRDQLRVGGPILLEGNFSTPGGAVRYIGTGTSPNVWLFNVPPTGRHQWGVNDSDRMELDEFNLKALTQIYSARVTDLVNAGTGAWTSDFKDGGVRHIVLRSGTNGPAFSHFRDGAIYTLILEQPAAGAAGTVGWPVGVRWAGGAAPVLSAVNGKVDIVQLTWNTTLAAYLGSVVALGC